MFKLIKYELRGNFLTIIGICITIIVANLLLITRRTAWGTNNITGLSIVLSIVGVTIIFVSSFQLMSKYLHTDTGYLLFTLPQSGTKIVLSKLLTALIQITLVVIVVILGVFLATGASMNFDFLNYVTAKGAFLVIFVYIWGNIYLLTFIYFCMVIGKVALRNKKFGKIGSFILFIFLVITLGWLESKLSGIFPQSIAFNNSYFFKNLTLQNPHVTFTPINISKLIFDLLSFVAFFKGTTYMLDNKLDL